MPARDQYKSGLPYVHPLDTSESTPQNLTDILGRLDLLRGSTCLMEGQIVLAATGTQNVALNHVIVSGSLLAKNGTLAHAIIH